jgi:hypothetical protein
LQVNLLLKKHEVVRLLHGEQRLPKSIGEAGELRASKIFVTSVSALRSHTLGGDGRRDSLDGLLGGRGYN